jgi:hypothetical protein
MIKFAIALLMNSFSPVPISSIPQQMPVPPATNAVPSIASKTAEKNLNQSSDEVDALISARSAVKHEMETGGSRIRHHFRFPDGTEVEFSDRPCRRGERAARRRVVAFAGTQTAADEPASTFETAGQAAGLSPDAVAALRFVSQHEGGFDAINTWDSARFSWGFIQFAGGRGLPPLLGHLKTRNPERFTALFGAYGVDVVADRDGDLEPVYVDASSGKTLRGKAAEQAYGDDPLTIAVFIRAARFTEIKQLQVEAAIEHYAAPALETPYQGVPLGQVLRSPKGMAMLIDRKVHEGNVRRFVRVLDGVESGLAGADPAVLEARVLEQVVSDAAARSGRTIESRLRDILSSDLAGPAGGV